MPIYAYKCDACGFAKDVLQKMSEDTLTDCPSCGKSEFKKQVTAAGFQLKGSGWYVTDFRGDKNVSSSAAPSGSGDAGESASSSSSDAATATPAAAPTATAGPAASSTPAANAPSAPSAPSASPKAP
jgi:putative FmdB family regulatory protein